jgi:hypothetical protein
VYRRPQQVGAQRRGVPLGFRNGLAQVIHWCCPPSFDQAEQAAGLPGRDDCRFDA